MTMTSTGYSLKQIMNYIGRALDSYVSHHKDEIVIAVKKDDYEDIPELPSFEGFYFGQLAPGIDEKMNRSGYSREDIEGVIALTYIRFFRIIVPSVLREHERKK